MKILGFETSCDETAVAVVEDGKRVLASALASSQELHVKSGGIIPEEAARKQIESIIPVLDSVLKSVPFEEIDKIAVTYGPGLIGSLLVGVETAKTLSCLYKEPLIAVNHLKAHIYANWVDNKNPPTFPAVALVVSGGHSDFVLIKSHEDIKYIGGTRDDAAGECFDKCARIIGLPYPGGPVIAENAKLYLDDSKSELTTFPRPMIGSNNLELSFSGLKTSVLNYTKHNENYDQLEIAANIQEAIVDSLVAKSLKAIEIYKPKSIILAGGVSANYRLRETLRHKMAEDNVQTKLYLPDNQYSTDNAVMVAACAYYQNDEVDWKELNANPSLTIEE